MCVGWRMGCVVNSLNNINFASTPEYYSRTTFFGTPGVSILPVLWSTTFFGTPGESILPVLGTPLQEY